MKLTDEILQAYVGGQLEITNAVEGYIYRGEIEQASIEGNDLHVRFKWIARMEGLEWHSQPGLDYFVDTMLLVSVSDIGEGRLHYQVNLVWERGTFFPPDGSKLDPGRVIGLQPAS